MSSNRKTFKKIFNYFFVICTGEEVACLSLQLSTPCWLTTASFRCQATSLSRGFRLTADSSTRCQKQREFPVLMIPQRHPLMFEILPRNWLSPCSAGSNKTRRLKRRSKTASPWRWMLKMTSRCVCHAFRCFVSALTEELHKSSSVWAFCLNVFLLF